MEAGGLPRGFGCLGGGPPVSAMTEVAGGWDCRSASTLMGGTLGLLGLFLGGSTRGNGWRAARSLVRRLVISGKSMGSGMGGWGMQPSSTLPTSHGDCWAAAAAAQR